MELRNILSILTVISFVAVFFLTKNRKRTYLLYVLWMFPFMDLSVLPVNLGGFEVFEVLTYFSFVFIAADFKFERGRFNLYVVLFAALVSVLFFGAVSSEFAPDALFSLIKFFPVFIFSKLLVDECIKDRGFVVEVFKTLRSVALIAVIFLAFQLVFGLSFTFYSDLATINANNSFNDKTRFTSFFPEPQACAQFFAMASFLFLVQFSKGLKYKILDYLLFLSVLYSLFMTGGRASFLGFCAGLIFIVVFANTRVKLIMISLAIPAMLIIAQYKESLTIFNRNETVTESSVFRVQRWKEAFQIFEKFPVMGIGIDNYRNYVTHHLRDQYWESDGNIVYYDNPENGYLKILTEYGGIGFSLVLALIIVPVGRGVKRFLDGRADFTVVLLCASLVSWLVSFVTVYTLTDLRILIMLATTVCLLIATGQSPYQKGGPFVSNKRFVPLFS